MPGRSKESDRHVASVLTAVRLLDCFNANEGLRLADLHHRTGLNKSRILRLVGSLEAAGVLLLEEATGRYRLGPKLYYLGRLVERRYDDLVGYLRPKLVELALQTRCVVYFSVREGHNRLVLVRRRGDGTAERVIKDGQVRPLHIGANGRVFLAFEPPAVTARLLGRYVTDPDLGVGPEAMARIHALLPQVRAEGHAIAFGETKPGHYVVAVPVRAESGRLLGTLAISCRGGRSHAAASDAQAQLLKQEAGLLKIGLAEALDAARPAIARRVAKYENGVLRSTVQNTR